MQGDRRGQPFLQVPPQDLGGALGGARRAEQRKSVPLAGLQEVGMRGRAVRQEQAGDRSRSQTVEKEAPLIVGDLRQVDDLALSEKLHGSCLERLRMPCQGQARSFGGGHPDVAAETGPPAEKTRGQFRNGFRQEIAHWQGGTGRFALVQPRPPRPVPARPERFRQTRKPRPF